MLRYIKKRVNRDGGEGSDLGTEGSGHSSPHNSSLADEAYRPMPSNADRKRRTNSKDVLTVEQLREQQRHLEETILSQKVEHLATFDACIEACDALAAASSVNATSRRDPQTKLVDCSVLVSPDGDLLLMPQTSMDDISNSMDGSLHELGEDYASAISVGYDLHPSADQQLNGFSANGWSIPATSLALRQTEQSLHDFADFCEEIVLSKKESAAKFNVACDKLRAVSFERGPVYPDDLQKDSQLMKTGDFALTSHRVGPMLFNGGSLHRAQVKLEEFYATLAEQESDRWRLASMQRKGALPPLRKAATLAEERSLNRQKTLREMYRRVQTMENHLQACQVVSAAKWKAVEEAEVEVSRILGDRMKERNRRLEDARLKEFQRMREQEEPAVGGATNSEIWDIVSQVNSDIENGSFEPIPFQQSMAQRARAASGESISGEDQEPMASRMDIEDEVGMGDLRAAAFAADRMVQSASGSLLSVLSSLDQVRRSARISAETNLLSAFNAQASCLQSMVRLERVAAEERLRQIEELERYVNKIDVRGDLNAYISEDRKRPGGSAPMGQDDDGGVASALAILTSHVEGEMGGGDSSGMYGSSGNSNQGKHCCHSNNGSYGRSFGGNVPSQRILGTECTGIGRTTTSTGQISKRHSTVVRCCYREIQSGSAQTIRMCYALNAKRSSHTELKTPLQFDALCKVFSAILSGCDCETGGVSNAKMCMMLSQTFFFVEKKDASGSSGGEDTNERRKRIYVKNRLIGHELWLNDEFWDQVLFQCLSESLTNSGVMANFERSAKGSTQVERGDNAKMQWYDLSPIERTEAASQVHAVVFAQLSALAHSMIEFGCGLERSCAFVRRNAIRNQLPLSQRTILLQHLVARKNDSETERVALLNEMGSQLESDGAPEEDAKDSIKPAAVEGNANDDSHRGSATSTALPDQLKSHIDN